MWGTITNVAHATHKEASHVGLRGHHMLFTTLSTRKISVAAFQLKGVISGTPSKRIDWQNTISHTSQVLLLSLCTHFWYK